MVRKPQAGGGLVAHVPAVVGSSWGLGQHRHFGRSPLTVCQGWPWSDSPVGFAALGEPNVTFGIGGKSELQKRERAETMTCPCARDSCGWCSE